MQLVIMSPGIIELTKARRTWPGQLIGCEWSLERQDGAKEGDPHKARGTRGNQRKAKKWQSGRNVLELFTVGTIREAGAKKRGGTREKEEALSRQLLARDSSNWPQRDTLMWGVNRGEAS